ncbi:MAG: nicotinate-nucleotide--dimethylbenzimidazole phosphoribosyltransferase, partial [Firmicutes bacterium]|nr:nicotinate-nucleotide--dimethylbenzimidazole phosphoribosyltransferase [Bacillota bacterium]
MSENKKLIEDILAQVESTGDPDTDAVKAAEARQEQLAKPTGALGYLEDITIRLAGITGQVKNDVSRQAVAVFSADNGVCAEGVASAPQSVTYSQTINMPRRFTGVSSMAKYWNFDLLVVNMGVKMDIPETLMTKDMISEGRIAQKIVDRRLAPGTEDLAKGPAMTDEQLEKAFLTGIEAA